LWNLGLGASLWALDRRLRIDRGARFAVYAMAYSAGRFWIEGTHIGLAQQVLGNASSNGPPQWCSSRQPSIWP
jgi:prolipoprotein diacylglyceryltransferase